MTERWLRLLFVAGIIGVLVRATPLVVTVSLMLGLVIFSLLLRLLAFRGARYERRLGETRAFVGERIRVTTRVSNVGRLPLFSLHVRDDAPRNLEEAPGNSGESLRADAGDITGAEHRRVDLSQLVALRPRSAKTAEYALTARRRGYYIFDKPTLHAVDLLGVSEQERAVPLRDTLLVYPRVFELDNVALPEQQPLGALASLRRLIEDPVRNMGARDYLPGDSFRQIHWKASAHRGTLQTRVNEHTADPVTHILLNVTTFDGDWVGVDVDRFEWSVSVAASMARWAHENGATLGLSSNGATPGLPEVLRVRARRSPDQLTRVLESLAVVQAFTATRFEEFLINEQRNVAFGASLLIVTGLVTERVAVALQRLRGQGKRMLLVSCDRTPPKFELPCAVIHMPPPEARR